MQQDPQDLQVHKVLLVLKDPQVLKVRLLLQVLKVLLVLKEPLVLKVHKV